LFFLGESNVNIWRNVDFINTNTGYFILFNGPLYKTSNGGGFWWSINSNLNMLVIKAFDVNILLGVDQYIIHRTTNGGQSWESNQSNLLDFGFDIEFLPEDPSRVWYISSRVCFSSDTGRSWVEEFSLNNHNFMDIIFTDANCGWLIARTTTSPYTARIFRTTNGGFGGLVLVEENDSELSTMKYYLRQNYPNPFNPVTKIKYNIPSATLRQAQSDILVTLKVYDILGTEIATLVNEEKPAGEYEVEFDGTKLTSGIYFYQLKTGDFIETRKMVLLK